MDGFGGGTRPSIDDSPAVKELTAALQAVNETIWQAEDDIRICEQKEDFGPRFVEVARSIYRCNDERSRLNAASTTCWALPSASKRLIPPVADAALRLAASPATHTVRETRPSHVLVKTSWKTLDTRFAIP